MTRVEERDWIIKLIYQNDFNLINLDKIDELLNFHEIESDFIKNSLVSIINNMDKIDEIINKNITSGNMKSLMAIERAILRVSVNEFIIEKTVPTSVSINEAVENTKKYSNEDSYKLINGILSSIAKDLG